MEFEYTWMEIEKSYESEDGKRIVEGWASTTEVDSEGLRMTRTAIQDMVKEFRIMRTVLHNHQPNEEIGVILVTEERKKSDDPEIWGCWVKVKISNSKDVNDIWTKIDEKILNGFSIRGKCDVKRVFEGEKVIQEAQSFKGAELSVVSVRALRPATIEQVYVEKMQRDIEKKVLQTLAEKGTLIMTAEKKEDEKIQPADALEAIKDLIENETEREAVMKLLESVDWDVKKEKKDEEEDKDEKEEEEKVKKEEASPATPEQIQVMESLAGGIKALYQQAKAAVSMESEEAIKGFQEVVNGMEKIVNAYPYPYPGEKKKEEEEEEEEEEKPEEEKKAVEKPVKKEEVKPSSEANALQGFADVLQEVKKDLANATAQYRDEQIKDLADVVISLVDDVKSLKSTIDNDVPIRKGLAISKKQKEQEKEVEKTFVDNEEYQKAGPHERMRMVFDERNKRVAELEEE